MQPFTGSFAVIGISALLSVMWFPLPAGAHHTLGINQTGKATESPQVPATREIRLEDYLISVTVLPGAPKPDQLTRLIVYAKNLQSEKPFQGAMAFVVSPETWFQTGAPFIDTTRKPIDGRYVQPIEFPSDGLYQVRLGFTDHNRSHAAQFELAVGTPTRIWQYPAAVALFAGLGWVGWKASRNRKRLRKV